MPTSSNFCFSPMAWEITSTKPMSILDVGFGYGKWGFLCREMLEARGHRIYPEDWVIKIDGIEIWKDYAERLPWINLIYDNVHIGDAHDVIGTLGNYDLIILGDVVEHLEKDKGQHLLRKAIEKSNKCCLLSIPIGDWTGNSLFDNNPYEEHISVWSEEDLINIGTEFNISVDNYFIQRQRNPGRAENCVVAFRK